MIEKFRKLFSPKKNQDAPTTDPVDTKLAAAILMVEAAHLDGSMDAVEVEAIKRLLVQHFELTDVEATRLFTMAEEGQAEAVHIHRFTKAIKDNYSESQRIELIELLWEVVYADGELHAHEANLLRRVGGLIYVSDRDRGNARKRVLKRLNKEQVK